jgi:hypothetical protein
MTRKFIDTLKGDITTNLLDNSSGLITPAVMRTITDDMCDSLKQDEATIFSNVTPAATSYNLTTSWATIGGAGVYDVETGDDSAGAGFLNVDRTNGIITGSATAGWSYDIRAGVTFSNITNGRDIGLAIATNGVPGDFLTSVVGSGADSVSRSWGRFIQTAGSSDAYSIMVIDNTGASTCDIESIQLYVSIIPTNNNA